MDQLRQRNYYQVLQGGYPPEGPMAEVLRAEAKTAGNSQRICKPRNPHRRPPTPGPGPQARRTLPTFLRWKVGRRRRDQVTKRREQHGRSTDPRRRQDQKTKRREYRGRSKTLNKARTSQQKAEPTIEEAKAKIVRSNEEPPVNLRKIVRIR